jgi:hypothetical protein
MDDVDDCARTNRFEVFEEDASVAAVRCEASVGHLVKHKRRRTVRGVYAFGGEVGKFLEVGVPFAPHQLTSH